MIQKSTSFKTDDGQIFGTIEEAQKHTIKLLLAPVLKTAPEKTAEIADAILADRDKIIDCLTMKPSSKPTARKANGAVRKPRTKPQVAVAAERSAAA